ncbi:unnamed protein product [Gadus morhua 'NCC']
MKPQTSPIIWHPSQPDTSHPPASQTPATPQPARHQPPPSQPDTSHPPASQTPATPQPARHQPTVFGDLGDGSVPGETQAGTTVFLRALWPAAHKLRWSWRGIEELIKPCSCLEGTSTLTETHTTGYPHRAPTAGYPHRDTGPLLQDAVAVVALLEAFVSLISLIPLTAQVGDFVGTLSPAEFICFGP